MRGIQREAGAPRPASTPLTGSPSRAEARSAGGACFRRRLLALLLSAPGLFTGAPGLVVAAPLLGVLGLFAAVPALAQSTDATLSGLTVTGSTSASGTFSAQTLSPAFAAGTTTYTVNVAKDISHVKFTATTTDSNATLKLTSIGNDNIVDSLSSGVETAAFPVNPGRNIAKVKVRAEDGTTTKDYYVYVRRFAVPRNLCAVPKLHPTRGTPGIVLSVDSVPVDTDISWSQSAAQGKLDINYQVELEGLDWLPRKHTSDFPSGYHVQDTTELTPPLNCNGKPGSIVSDLGPGATYKIRAHHEDDNSVAFEESTPVKTVTVYGVPGKPTQVEVEVRALEATVTWRAPSPGYSEEIITGYKVRWRPQGGAWNDDDGMDATVAQAASGYEITEFDTYGIGHEVQVRAVSGLGGSDWSDTLTFTPISTLWSRWSSTLTVTGTKSSDNFYVSATNQITGSGRWFRWEGVEYKITKISPWASSVNDENGRPYIYAEYYPNIGSKTRGFILELNKPIPADMKENLCLQVGSSRRCMSDATDQPNSKTVRWTDGFQRWDYNQPIRLSFANGNGGSSTVTEETGSPVTPTETTTDTTTTTTTTTTSTTDGGGGGTGGTGGGDGGSTPRNLMPSFGSANVPDQSYTEGTEITPLELPAARGGDGRLFYALSPVLPEGLTLNRRVRRLSGTPTTPQAARQYTWTATDADGDEAELTFTIAIAVDPHRERIRELARRVLAEMARRAMSGALDTIGARFGAIGGSGLSLAGQPVSLESVASVADGVGMAVWNNQSLALGELLGESAFSLRLAATGNEDSDGDVNLEEEGPLWSVWGRGDLTSFAGGREEEAHYDGWLRSGWLGIDARAGRWVAGMAVSHEQGQADYGATVAAAASDRPMQGRLETSLTALYPYGRWQLTDGMELQGVVGVGWGEAHHTPADEQRETGTLSMRMASLGVRKSLPDVAGLDLALRADAAVTRIETGHGPEVIHNLSADSWRLRTGLEASRRFSLEGEVFLEPFLEAAARQDGGDGLEGSGVELAGGLRYSAPSVAVELRGRWLAAHSEEGAEEQGVSLTARYGPGADDQGLFFALSPRWGAATGGAQALWREDLPVLSTASAEDSGAVDAQVGYGFALPQGGVLTPFAEVGLAGADSRRLRLGTRYAAAVTGLDMAVELAGERRESGDAAAEHALQLDVDLRF